MIKAKMLSELKQHHRRLLLTSILRRPSKISFNCSRWSLRGVPSYTRRLNRRCFKSNLLVIRDLVMYKISNFNHKPTTISSSSTSVMTSSAKHNMIVECAFSSKGSRFFIISTCLLRCLRKRCPHTLLFQHGSHLDLP